MQVAAGTVIGGEVVVEGLSLPEGAFVMVVTRKSEATVRLSALDEAELLEALDEADPTEGISPEDMFERLHKFG